MGKKRKKNKGVEQQHRTILSDTNAQEVRDFGILKTKGKKISQVQAPKIISGSKGGGDNFSNMSNDRIVTIIKSGEPEKKRALSNYFFETNGIYARTVRYLSDLYRFDYIVYPSLDLDKEVEEKAKPKFLKRFNEVLDFFDSSDIQMMSRTWASSICLDGVYYGYVCDDISDKLVIQDLPTDYCRSRFKHRGKPLVEFNVEYFDKVTNDVEYRKQLLLLFPKEIQKGYSRFKGTKGAEKWIILDTRSAFKFSLNKSDTPPLLFVIPALLNLQEVQDLEKEKLLQQLEKILIQTFELDKNGQIPFTMTELSQLNENAMEMVGDAVGVNVLSTVAKVHMEDLSNDGDNSKDNTEAAQKAVYNDTGISANLFNTTGNLSLEKSIMTDIAFVKMLPLQFQSFFNDFIEFRFNKGNIKFKLKILETSIFNNGDLSDKYKDLTRIGFSRFLPMIALGHSQKEVISMAKLEQQIIELDRWMLPPFSSNTLSSDAWTDLKKIQGGSSEKGGRPELPDDKKSEKTLANRESITE